MKITLTRNTVLGHEKAGAIGETVEVSDRLGRDLVLLGRAVEAETVSEPATVEPDPDPEPPAQLLSDPEQLEPEPEETPKRRKKAD